MFGNDEIEHVGLGTTKLNKDIFFRESFQKYFVKISASVAWLLNSTNITDQRLISKVGAKTKALLVPCLFFVFFYSILFFLFCVYYGSKVLLFYIDSIWTIIFYIQLLWYDSFETVHSRVSIVNHYCIEHWTVNMQLTHSL